MLTGPDIHAPLLDDDEISRLLQASGRFDGREITRPPRRGGPGELVTAVRGMGTDFAEVRPYHTGDDPRRIDWRATARSRVPLVRTYHTELSRPLCLVIDRSAAMRFGTRVRLKVAQAVRLALWLAGREVRAGRELAAMLIDSPCHWLPPKRGMRATDSLVQLANAPCPPIDPTPNEPHWSKLLAGLRQRLPQGSELVLLSDFTGLSSEDDRMLNTLGMHCATLAVRIIDPTEIDLPAVENLQLNWGNRTQLINQPHSDQSAQLAQSQRAWSESLLSQFKRAGIQFREVPTHLEKFTALARELH